jgi:hypothetical protein
MVRVSGLGRAPAMVRVSGLGRAPAMVRVSGLGRAPAMVRVSRTILTQNSSLKSFKNPKFFSFIS